MMRETINTEHSTHYTIYGYLGDKLMCKINQELKF